MREKPSSAIRNWQTSPEGVSSGRPDFPDPLGPGPGRKGDMQYLSLCHLARMCNIIGLFTPHTHTHIPYTTHAPDLTSVRLCFKSGTTAPGSKEANSSEHKNLSTLGDPKVIGGAFSPQQGHNLLFLSFFFAALIHASLVSQRSAEKKAVENR